MEIKILKKWKIGRHNYKPGAELIVTDWQGQKLVDAGIAKQTEGVDVAEFVEKVEEKKKEAKEPAK